MTYQEIEEIFNRAVRFSFSRVKSILIFPVLLVCSVLFVFCRAIVFEANSWVVMSLSFLPVFLCTGVLLAAGVLVTRMYYHEVKGLHISFRKLLAQSFQLLIGISHLSFPLIFTYLLLWTLMGVFHLLKGIPAIGEVMSVLLSFGPFLLVLASLVLSFVSVLMLFFVTPHVALKTHVHLDIAEEVMERMKVSVFSNVILFIIGLTPLLLCLTFLIAAAVLTGANYLSATAVIGVSLGWFFMMIPFCLILTPFISFFFNFAMESFSLMQKKRKGGVIHAELEKEIEETACVAK